MNNSEAKLINMMKNAETKVVSNETFDSNVKANNEPQKPSTVLKELMQNNK